MPAPPSSGVESLPTLMNGGQRSAPGSVLAPTPREGAPDPEDLPPTAALKRAVSCDSVCSDTSVNLENLEESNTTGFLCIGLEYDRFVIFINIIIIIRVNAPIPNQQRISCHFKMLYIK